MSKPRMIRGCCSRNRWKDAIGWKEAIKDKIAASPASRVYFLTIMTTATHTLLDELRWRGLLYQHTEGVTALFQHGTTSGYVGFDPTAKSLHIGSLVPIMALVHLQRSGHRPIALVGGGTGLIGDPGGKTSERALLSAEQVDVNVRGIRAQLARFLDFDDSEGRGVGAILVDNAEWLLTLRTIDFMRDVGKHFTVNYMMQKESVRARLDAGISFTEFGYMLLQAYDFLELHRRHGATLQMGGSDQWGNITAGIELIRRTASADAQGVTMPLETTALSAAAFELLRTEAPFAELAEADVTDPGGQGGGGLDVLKLLTAVGLASSNGAARRLLEQGGVSVNKRKLGATERFVPLES